MDPVMKAWMFYSWIEDYGDEFKLLENQGYLIGSFINPEAVRKIMGKDSETFTSSDEEFDETTRQVMEENKRKDEINNLPKRKRKRKIQE